MTSRGANNLLVVLSAYTLDGDHRGWVTSRGTISGRLDKAERIEQGDAVLRRITALEYEWRGHGLSWIQERAPLDVAAKSNNATTKVDTAGSAVRGSSTPQESTMKSKQQKRTTDSPSKPATAKPAKPITASPTKLLPNKPVMRTTAAARLVAASSDDEPGKPCLCGCGELVAGFLKRGHFKRLEAKLKIVKVGSLTPENAFGRPLAKAMGPWRKTRAGVVPTTTDYAAIRANLQ